MSSITSSVEQLLSSNVRGIKYLIIRLLYHSKCCMYRDYYPLLVNHLRIVKTLVYAMTVMIAVIVVPMCRGDVHSNTSRNI